MAADQETGPAFEAVRVIRVAELAVRVRTVSRPSPCAAGSREGSAPLLMISAETSGRESLPVNREPASGRALPAFS